MITGLVGKLVRVLEDEIRLEVGSIEYQVLVPELVRRAVQSRLGETIELRTMEYLEGNPQRGRLVPRLVGFLSEAELEFFELFCTVDGIGVRTALKALVRSVRDIADLIQRQDTKGLSTLPGISGSTAERVVAKLRKKVTKFALMVGGDLPEAEEATASVAEDALQALLSVGHGEQEARARLDRALAGGRKYKSPEELLLAIYQQG